MERLTGYSESHNEGFLEEGCPENLDCLSRDCNDCSVGKAVNKLAEYENLGYTPSELREIIEANQITRAWEREKELEAYKNKPYKVHIAGKDVMYCDSCDMVCGDGLYCRMCGEKLDWSEGK